jgi:hypothetical protein
MNEPMDRQEGAKMVLRTQGSNFRFFTSPKFDQKKVDFCTFGIGTELA